MRGIGQGDSIGDSSEDSRDNTGGRIVGLEGGWVNLFGGWVSCGVWVSSVWR